MSDSVKKYLTIIEMSIGIILFALVSQIVAFFASKRIIYYGLGIWLGAILAILCAIHMYHTFDKAFDFDEKNAIKIARNGALLRYFVLCAIFAVIMIFDIFSPLTTFLGLMGLKAGAYLQPLTHKTLIKMGKIEPDPIPEPMPEEEEDLSEKDMSETDMNQLPEEGNN